MRRERDFPVGLGHFSDHRTDRSSTRWTGSSSFGENIILTHLPGSKMQVLFSAVQVIFRGDPRAKILMFVQWGAMRDLLREVDVRDF